MRLQDSPLLQNHPSWRTFPISVTELRSDDRDMDDGYFRLYTLAFLLGFFVSIVMLIVWGIFTWTSVLTWSYAGFILGAKICWGVTAALLGAIIVRYVQLRRKPKQEQKLYNRLTGIDWLSKEKREALRLTLIEDYDSGFWSETLEYYPLEWKVAGKEHLFTRFLLAKEATYISSMQKWWSIEHSADLKNTIAQLLKGMHAPLYAQEWQRNSALIRELHNLTALPDSFITATVAPNGNYPPMLVWAFDLQRAINLARSGYMARYLTEDEAWDYILRAADLIYNIFPDLDTYHQNWLLGCAYWSRSTERVALMQTSMMTLKSCDWPMMTLKWRKRREGALSPEILTGFGLID